MVEGGAESVKIDLDNLCIDGDKKVMTGHSLSKAEGGSLMKNIGKDFNEYFRTNVSMDSLMDYIFIRKVYKSVYEKIKNILQGPNDTLIKEIKQFHICGMPMIGKTHFLYYVLARLLVDFPELPGIATLGVLPGASSDMEFFNELKCVETTTGTGDEKKVRITLEIAEVAHNQPPSDSKEIQTRYKNYIFLIDNAKREYVYLTPFLLERIMILLICCITLEEQLVI